MKIFPNRNTGDPDAYFRFRDSHMTRTKFEFIQKRILSHGSTVGYRILEIGCGPGIVSTLVANTLARAEIHSIDCDTQTIEVNRSRTIGVKNLFYHTLDFTNTAAVQELVDRVGCFDMIYSIDCIHHVNHYGRFVENVNRLLKTGGIYTCIEPNPYNPYIFMTHSLTQRESNFKPRTFLAHTKPLFYTIEQEYLLLIPEWVRRPAPILKKVESYVRNIPLLNGSIGLSFQKI